MTQLQNTASSKDVSVVTNIVPEAQLRKAQLRALKIFADAVSCTYGPMGGYTAYSLGDTNQKAKGIVSNYTKDGFTVLKHVDVDKPIEYLLKTEIRDICTRVIKVIGDGTTSATMLSYFIFAGLLNLQQGKNQKSNISRRHIIKHFKEIIKEGIQKIEENKRETTVDDIYNIALTSLNGNEEMAEMIKNIYAENGMDVFIDVMISNTPETITKTYSGMTYESGFISPAFVNNPIDQTCDLNQVHTYVFESPIDTPEMLSLVDMIIKAEIENPYALYQKQKQAGKQATVQVNPTLIISPFISRDANSYIDQLINQFTQAAPESRPPLCLVTNISNDNNFLSDIMAMTGAKFIKKYIDPKAYEHDKVAQLAPTEKTITTFAGYAEKVVIDALSTRIINPKNMYDADGNRSEFFTQYLAQLETLLNKYEETHEELVKIGNLKRRINILKANMVDLHVGGIGVSDRDALKDSIEDAVLNCRSAAKEGVGFAANYEGLRAFNEITKAAAENSDNLRKNDSDNLEAIYDATLHYAVANIILQSYVDLCAKIYLPYQDYNEHDALAMVMASLANEDETKRCPFNVITEDFDKKVLTSIKTEPAMLEAMSKIISLLFNTNQFLVPDARFNIYTMDSYEEDIPAPVEEEPTKEVVTEETAADKIESEPVEEVLNKETESK